MQFYVCFWCTFIGKNVCAMDLRKKFPEIKPEQSYSVSEAARFLGIHRCTIYDYITHTERPLPFFRSACFFCPSTAFFVDKAPACYYNSVVKMAFLCGFVAARKKYS